MFRRLFIVAVVVLVFAAAFVFWKFSHPSLATFIEDSTKKKYNILLITIDTLRADHLHCYGFNEISTPNIDSLAANGVLFKDATAHIPLTLPSHTSIHTGRFPSFHGVRDNGGFYVPKSETTIAELMKKHGFATAAFVGAFVLDSMWGLNQGFDTYYDHFDASNQERIDLGAIQRKGEDVYKEAIGWLDQHRSQRFFLWTHFYDPHSPYEPPPEFDRQYPNHPYIGEIAYTDSVVGKLIKYLEDHNFKDNTVILLTGDHGESLGEHGESTHAFFIYDATLHVPLILNLPDKKFAGRIVTEQARSVDIAPTLLQLSGIPVPENVQGRSLLHLLFDAERAVPPSYAECFYPQFHFGWSRLLSLRDGNFQYIDSSRPELYDLKHDPGELTNLYDARRDVAAKMKSELVKFERPTNSESSALHPGDVDAETHEKLAALGYVGAFSGPINVETESLPDPKDKIELFNLVGSAHSDSLSGDSEKAIQKLKHAIELDPKIVDAYFMLGNEYVHGGDYANALPQFKKALELKPDYDAAVINMANTYQKMGKTAEAIAGFQYFLKKNPTNSQVLNRIAEIYLIDHQPDQALEYLQRAMKSEPDTSWIHNSIGVAYLQKKLPQKAEQSFHKALTLNPKVKMAHFNLAQLYESQGKIGPAEQEYLLELKSSPKNYKAHFNLGRLYLQLEQIPQGIHHLEEVIQDAPEFPLGYLFLAQAYVESGDDLQRASELAKKGLELKPDAEYRPLAHLVLADIYNRQGQYDLERKEIELARQSKMQ